MVERGTKWACGDRDRGGWEEGELGDWDLSDSMALWSLIYERGFAKPCLQIFLVSRNGRSVRINAFLGSR